MKILLIGGMGYIGSRVYDHLIKRYHEVTSVDLGLFGGPDHPNNLIHFRDLSPSFVRQFDTVIHLAGHSSVQSCEINPPQAMKNNCVDFFHLVNKITPNQQFIYASSASVYGSVGEHLAVETDLLPEPVKDYDRQKQLIDLYMEQAPVNYFGLRFGTVCGYSPNPRNELLINAMTRDAKVKNLITATSAKSFRAVLGLNDLCRAISAIVDRRGLRGVYNLASLNMSIGDIGREIYRIFPSNLHSRIDGNSSYSFCLDTTKFQKSFDFEFIETVEDIAREASRNDFTVERTWTLNL